MSLESFEDFNELMEGMGVVYLEIVGDNPMPEARKARVDVLKYNYCNIIYMADGQEWVALITDIDELRYEMDDMPAIEITSLDKQPVVVKGIGEI